MKVNYTVKELIEALRKLPQDMPILTTGYETGYENIVEPKIIRVEYTEDAEYWDGAFQETEAIEGIEVVILDREVRRG